MTENFNSTDSNEISIKEIVYKINQIFQYLLSKSRIILIVTIAGTLFGYFYAYKKKEFFQASMIFTLEEDKGPSASGLGGLASQFGIDLGSGGGGGIFTGSNILELMKSKLIIEETLLSPIDVNNEKISLAEYYIRLNNLRKDWGHDSNYNKLIFSVYDNRENFNIYKNIILQRIYSELISNNKLVVQQLDKKLSFITVNFLNSDEIFTKIFCENLINTTSKFYSEIKTNKARKNVNLLQQETDSVRHILNNSILNNASETDNVFNLNSAMNIKKTSITKRQIDVQANTLVLSTLTTNLELAKINLMKETPLFQIIEKPTFPLGKLVTNKSKYALMAGIASLLIISLYFTLLRWFKIMMK